MLSLPQPVQQMSDDNKYSDDDKNPKKSGEFRVPPRTWVVWIAIFGGIILLMLFKDRMEPPGDVLNQYKFQQLVESNQIVQATINYSPQSPDLREITGKYCEDRERSEGRGAIPRQGAAVSRSWRRSC